MSDSRKRLARAASLCLAALLASGCGAAPSRPETVEIPVSTPKRQTVSNCWLHTVVGWAEALTRAPDGAVPDYSVSYLTYRLLEDSLSTGQWGVLDDISGNFFKGTLLIQKHGLMREADFRAPDGSPARSDEEALAALRESLQAGRLRDAAALRAEMNRAYGVVMESLESKIMRANEVSLSREGVAATLDRHLLSWQPETWSLAEPALARTLANAFAPQSLTGRQEALLGRIKRALGAGFALPISWYVDLNALDGSGVFSARNCREAGGRLGAQGGHSTLLVDYQAMLPSGRLTAEGALPNEAREEAEASGKVAAFIVKNSWGAGPGQENHATYRYGESLGFTKIEASYLFGWIPEAHPRTGDLFRFRSGLESVVLPPGF